MKRIQQIRKTELIAIVLLCITTSSAFAKWTRVAEIQTFAQGRWGIQALTANGKIYVGGGYYGTFGNANDWQEYDPATDMWTYKKDMPGATNRSAGITFTINGKSYLGLGIENFNSFTATWAYLKDLWEYDATTDTWTKKADFPGTGTGFCGVFVINNKAYIVGGSVNKSGTYTNDVHEYDPATNKWTKKASFPETDISAPFAFSLGSKGYISCGGTQNGATDKTYEYDPATDKWTAKGNFPGGAVASGVTFYANGTVYCGLGSAGSGIYPKIFYSYNPKEDSWSYAGGFEFGADGRGYARAVTLDGKVYMGAGWKFVNGAQTWYRDWHVIDPTKALDISNVKRTNTISIYPNPATDNLYVDGVYNGQSFTLVDITGKLIKSGVITVGNINISDIVPGAYTLNISTADGNISSMFLKK